MDPLSCPQNMLPQFQREDHSLGHAWSVGYSEARLAKFTAIPAPRRESAGSPGLSHPDRAARSAAIRGAAIHPTRYITCTAL